LIFAEVFTACWKKLNPYSRIWDFGRIGFQSRHTWSHLCLGRLQVHGVNIPEPGGGNLHLHEVNSVTQEVEWTQSSQCVSTFGEADI